MRWYYVAKNFLPLVAVGAMMLVEEGKIQLTDPVSKFLPTFKGNR